VQDGREFITGHYRAVVRERLICVHDPRKINASGRVSNELLLGALGDYNREGWWCHDVEVSGLLGRSHIVMKRMLRVNRRREFPQVFPAYLIRLSGRVLATREAGINTHSEKL